MKLGWNAKSGCVLLSSCLCTLLVASGFDRSEKPSPRNGDRAEVSALSTEPFIGEIMLFGGNFAPRGWAKCDGQLLAISSNQALFSILGTTYGGDGRTTFGLPDLRGRVPVHTGQGPGLSNYRLGQKGGAESVRVAAPKQAPVKPKRQKKDQDILIGTNDKVSTIQPYTAVTYVIALQGIFPSRN